VRKVNFKNNPGVVPELDLIEEADRITHNVSLDDEFIEELNLDKFKFDPNFAQQEA
jgi:pre-mRNA-splicing factor CWC22